MRTRTLLPLLGLLGLIAQLPAACRADADRAPAGENRVRLVPVFEGLEQPTDVQFWPGDDNVVVVLEKTGRAQKIDLTQKKAQVWFAVEVPTRSEQGLLGLAFHPDFAKNRLFYVNSTPRNGSRDLTEISEWEASEPPKKRRVLLEVDQPYPNHNAGQLAFGPDKMLYIGFGDGGAANDPHGHGQNPKTMLGKMLRIDPLGQHKLERSGPGYQRGDYGIPEDNPARSGPLPELFALGLRNPWRYSFDPRGRLVVADVGQNAYEEISIVEAGKNYGWNVREAAHCFQPAENCPQSGLVDPIYEYGRGDGASITGGLVVLAPGPLKDKYLFGDFVSGRLWSLRLPRSNERVTAERLGKFELNPSTFGRDGKGVLYVADFGRGRLLRIEG